MQTIREMLLDRRAKAADEVREIDGLLGKSFGPKLPAVDGEKHANMTAKRGSRKPASQPKKSAGRAVDDVTKARMSISHAFRRGITPSPDVVAAAGYPSLDAAQVAHAAKQAAKQAKRGTETQAAAE